MARIAVGIVERRLGVELEARELELFQRARRTGDLDIFTERYFRLPMSGTWFTPEDNVEQFSALFDVWQAAGQPENEFQAIVDDAPVQFNVSWDQHYAPHPIFLMPHGFRSLPWLKKLLDPRVSYGIAVTGAGTGKTCGVAIAALTMCALYPGFRFLNVAPTAKQAKLMLKEIEKWAANTPFRKFITETKGANPLWIERPHPVITIEVVEGHPSLFTCQTVGRDATGILGDEQDWINGDEAALLTGIHQAHPILVSRFRGTRSTGEFRLGKLTWITNPSDNPEFDALIERYQDMEKKKPDEVVVLESVHSSENVYVTKHQLKQQAMMMDEREMDRWQGGERAAVHINNEIGEHLVRLCEDDELERLAQKVGQYDDAFGLREYELPWQKGRHYIVVGDLGKSNVGHMSSQNIPCIMVFDVTQFLDEPTKLVAFYWFNGEGTYATFVDKFKHAMRRYRTYGYYDATNVQTALEDFDGVLGSLPNTFPVFFSGTSGRTRWAIGAAILMMQDGLFAWPVIKALRFQARVYRHNKRNIPKDIISTIMVFFFALEQEGALYDKLMNRFDYREEPQDEEENQEQDQWDGTRQARQSRYERVPI